MRDHVTFKTTLFHQGEGNEASEHPGRVGEDCAAWLRTRLLEAGVRGVAAPGEEDWGWYVPILEDGERFQLNVGLIPELDPEWCVQVQHRPRLLARLLGSAHSKAHERVISLVHSALSATPSICDVRWHHEDQFMKGVDGGAPSPSTP
jgi:hypothetical protein